MKKFTSIIYLLLLSLIYLFVGYQIGHYKGYQDGQKDYLLYMNQILKDRNY